VGIRSIVIGFALIVSAPGPFDHGLALGGRVNLYRAGLFKRLHKIFYLILVICFQDQDKGMLPIQYGIAANTDTELAGIGRAKVGQERGSHFWVLGGAGLGVVLVAYKKEGHFDLLIGELLIKLSSVQGVLI
jgi:hypothetical protein